MSRLLKITDLGSGIMVHIGKIEIGGETVTKQNINAKFDAIANQESGGGGDVTGLFADASYDSQTKHINFYDKDNTLVAYVDATDFIKDGMVSNVEILNGNLVITFNTDAGKEPITIPLTDIFNPNNYYTKTDANGLFATQVVVNEEIAARIAGDSALQTALGGKADKTDTYTKAQVDTALAAKVSQTEFDTKEEVISTALNSLDTNKQDKLTAGQNITIQNNVISATGGGGTQQQADWNQTDTTAVDFIKNKPDTSDFVSINQYNPKELAIAKALTELNENKADKTEIPDVSTLATKTELNAKQDTLVSGTNIKTINNQNILGSGNINISGGGGNYVQYDSQDEYPVTLIKRMNRLDYDALAGNEDPNTLYIVTPIEWKVLESDNFQFGDGNPTDLFAQTLPAQQIADNEYPTVTLYEDLDKSSSPIQGSWSYDSSAYIGTLTWTDSDGGSCSMVIEFTVIGGSDIVIDDASKITYTNPNNHCYAVEWQ